jgi:predicted DNA-binding protein
MTAIVPRRFFDDAEDDQIFQGSSKEQDLKGHGLIRSSLIIPIEHNERLKLMARKLGKNTDQLIGELHMEFVASMVDQWEAQQEAIRLRERFGENWLEILTKTST